MATTCQQIVQRAAAFSPLNAPLVTDPVEMLARLASVQQAVWTATVDQNRDRFQVTAVLTATAAPRARLLPFTALDRPLERVLRLVLADGREVSQVDPLDVEAELAPRYVANADGLLEVGSDWGPNGAVTATVTYCYGPAPLVPSGSLGQLVSLPDEWADLLVLPLAMYCVQKDPGRDPAEYDRLAGMRAEVEQRWAAHLAHRSGVETRRFVIPTPTGSKR